MQIEEGNTATLRCELSKSGHAVEWRKRGNELIRNGDKYHMRQRDMLIEMKIFNVTPEDSNIYTCICGNIETTATLTVNGGCLLFTVIYLVLLLYLRFVLKDHSKQNSIQLLDLKG